jgi:hypothetical protein
MAHRQVDAPIWLIKHCYSNRRNYCAPLGLYDWFADRPKESKPKIKIMTVCIASISRNIFPDQPGFMVIGATDGMLTGQEMIEFEPKRANKIFHFSTSISGMFAGEFGFQTEIIRDVIPVVQDRIKSEPQRWWKVKEVAQLYANSFKRAHLKRAENSILFPLGYDFKSFHADQKQMEPELARQLSTRLHQFDSPGIEAIFCGMDSEGAHIYVVTNSANVICHDVVGFAAIGIGAWHANSQFMFAEHNPFKDFSETLFLTYSAKKRAEVAPGVGDDTYMFLIGPELGSHVPSLGEHVFEKLEKAYNTNQVAKLRADEKSHAQVEKFFEETIRKTAETKKQQEATSSANLSPPSPTPSTNSPPPSDEKKS